MNAVAYSKVTVVPNKEDLITNHIVFPKDYVNQ